MDIFQIIRCGTVGEFMDAIKSVDINVVNEEGENMLHKAVARNADIAFILIDMGIELNHQAKDKSTPLHYAAHHNQLEIARKIIEKGGDVNIIDKHGNTPLWYAMHFARDNYDLVELLIKAGTDTSIVNNAGRTVFAIAERHNNDKLNSLLSL